VPLIQTAIAEVGSGDRAAGIWHWHMAQTLYPKSAESDLSAFGEPGAVLKRNLLTAPRLKQCRTSQANTPPAPTTQRQPDYPRGAKQFGNQGDFIVDVKIRADGTVAEPRIVRPLPAPLAYAALEAVRGWRFTPATRNGAPVDVNFCLAVKFRIEE
jgi:TonB family protein